MNLPLREHRRLHHRYYGQPVDVQPPHAGFQPLIPFASVKHLWDEGRFFDIIYDFENAGLDKRNGAILEASGMVIGLDGRPFIATHIPFILPRHKVTEPLAPVVAGIYPDEVLKGFPAHIGAGLFRDFIEDATRLDGQTLGLPLYEGQAVADAEEGEEDDAPDDEGAEAEKKKKPAEYVYTFQFADGPRSIIINHTGQKFRLEGEEKWRKIVAVTRPFKGETYDDPYLSFRLAEAGHRDIKITERRKFDVDRMDAWATLIYLHVFGRKDALRLEAGSVWDAKAGRYILRTRLADFLAGNSPSAMRERGIDNEGIYLTDGRYPDLTRLHGSFEDTALTAAALAFARRTQPEMMARLESRLGLEAKRQFLRYGSQAGFVDRVPFGYIDYDRRSYSPFMAMLLAGDDAHGNNSRGVIVNLSVDPNDYANMSDDDIRRELERKNNPLFRVVDFRQTLLAEEFDAAYRAGVGNELAPHIYHQRAAHWRTHHDLSERVMRCYQQMQERSAQLQVRAVRTPADDAYTGFVKRLPRYRIRDPRTGKTLFIPPDVYDRAQDKYRRLKTLSGALAHRTEGHAVEVLSDDALASSAVARYRDMIKRSDSSLAQLQRGSDRTVVLPPIVDDLSDGKPVVLTVRKPRSAKEVVASTRYVETAEDARKHLWLSRAAHEHVRDQHNLHHTFPEYWLIDAQGRRLDWQAAFVSDKTVRFGRWLQGGVAEGSTTLDIDFATNPSFDRLVNLLRVFDADDYNASNGSDAWKKWWKNYVKTYYGELRPVYEAWCRYAVQGPENLDPVEHGAMSARKAVRMIDRMRRETSAGGADEYVRLVLGNPEGRALMAAWRKKHAADVRSQGLKAEHRRILNIDPSTGWPVKRARFRVDPKKLVRLKVPDRMLDYASHDPVWGQHHLIEKPTAEQKRAIERGASVVLEGAVLGVWRLASKATIEAITDEEIETDAHRRSREFAEADYASVGATLGGHSAIRRMRFEQITPIHGWKGANENRQVMPVSDHQLGAMLNDGYGGLSVRQQGLILLDTGARFSKGPLWLRRTVDGVETGDQYQAEITSARCVLVSDLLKLSDKDAEKLGGIRTATSLYSYWQRQASEHTPVNERRHEASQQKVWIVEVKPVTRAAYSFHHEEQHPWARFGRAFRYPRSLMKAAL